ncbi:Outer membrane lipoprotein-sorting protein [Candidatus Frackibacter sp. WG12]|nr:Outer membrane lipoprotein-sorting protein [Candidatus Frackibacter sp. WG11]SEM99372.1 Outer membrane lipoprotein-sorting protein [Candidatus Frackibacter sp. WG12]SFM07390.1 Outer membrane lipoprotein-sorting protein [Candidatus Frackibacter sp. WG13]
MMSKKIIVWMLIGVLACSVGLGLRTKRVMAKQLSVDEIIQRAYTAAYYQGKDGRSVVDMTIVDQQGRRRHRRLTMLRKDVENNGKQKIYAYFHEPADVRKMVYMVYKNPGSQDDRWLYLPALDLVRRIAASDKRSSFVGSHFTYEDISGRGLQEDKHILIGEDKDYYILKHIPKDKANVKFAYYKMWIDKDNFIPVKSEYYDQNDKVYRVITAEKVEKIQGYPTITVMKAKNLETGAYTINRFLRIKYDLELPDRIFSERYLRRPPRRWLR